MGDNTPCATMNSSNMSHGLHFQDKFPLEFAVPIYGYLSPFLIVFTVVNNGMVIIILLRKHMRTPTNCILIGMAVSDLLTGVIPLPVFLHFFTFGYYTDFVPFGWCHAFKYLWEHIPVIFHTASIWLTVALAVQRYIYICHSFRAKSWCTIDNVIKGTVIIYILAIVIQMSRFFENEIVPCEVRSVENPNTTIVSCNSILRPWFKEHQNIYFSLYFWFRVIFIHIVPCTSLVVLNALLILAMRNAQKRRMQLLKQNKKSESRKLKDSNCTTLMLVAVVGLFLLVEFPLGIIMATHIISNTFELKIIHRRTVDILTLMSNFFIIVSYPLNFFIYCGMSRQFRETFKKIFCGKDVNVEREISQYMTIPTENGKTGYTGDETAL